HLSAPLHAATRARAARAMSFTTARKEESPPAEPALPQLPMTLARAIEYPVNCAGRRTPPDGRRDGTAARRPHPEWFAHRPGPPAAPARPGTLDAGRRGVIRQANHSVRHRIVFYESLIRTPPFRCRDSGESERSRGRSLGGRAAACR